MGLSSLLSALIGNYWLKQNFTIITAFDSRYISIWIVAIYSQLDTMLNMTLNATFELTQTVIIISYF